MYMILNCNKSECCGCTSCYNVCPKSAISMKEDLEGFLIPVINQDLCIECGKCRNVCGFKEKNINVLNNQKVYAIKRKDISKRMESQSGGAFSCIAEYFLRDNAIVYGVSMDKSLHAAYTRINSENELINLKGSKYVQAVVGNIYKDVEKDLKCRQLVLFSGTPCHVDGLLHYLKTKKVDTTFLYTCDIVCHGVPSPKLFKDYIEFTEKEYNSNIINFNFRDKTFGWHGHKTSMILDTGKKNIISVNYVNIFYSHLGLRSSCYECPYTSTNRVSDFTIADFWGIERIHTEFDDNKGCSLMILNSKKSKNIFERIKNDINYIESSIEECIQPNLKHPTDCPNERDMFWEDYHDKGFEYVVKKYCQYDIDNDYIYSFKNRTVNYMKMRAHKILNLIRNR